jgi:acetyl esterase/lipase
LINKLTTLLFRCAALSCWAFSITSCAVRKTSSVTYQEGTSKFPAQQLDVYAPRKVKSPRPVLVFIHGGNWNSGKKSQYWPMGRNFARKGIVTVIIDYPLSPAANYDDMAKASAKAVQWTVENIGKYGGDTSRLFLSGHSAGGHLAALIGLDDEYFKALSMKNPAAGLVLIDAAGLDMYNYLLEKKYPSDNTYIKTFTNDSAIWKKASPRYYLKQDMPPMLIYRGGETYESIETSTEAFMGDYRKFVPNPRYKVLKGKKHVPMIVQFFWPWNKYFGEIGEFMKKGGNEIGQTKKRLDRSKIIH